MAIDRSGEWWTGEEFADLAEYIALLCEEGCPAGLVVQSLCSCGSSAFRLRFDADEGCAERTRVACGVPFLICDSAEYWDEAEPEPWVSSCGGSVCEIGVGFSLPTAPD